MQDFSSLEIELLKYGFRKISYRELNCLRCGTWRIACDGISESLEGCRSCPKCLGKVETSPPLCWGFTRRETPFSERIRAPLSVNAVSLLFAHEPAEGAIERKEQKRGQRASHYAKADRIRRKDFEWESLPRKQWAAP